MKNLRNSPPKSIGELEVLKIEDYLPRSDILIFSLVGENRIIIRPSGTEPKIKFYIMVREFGSEKLKQSLLYIEEQITHLLQEYS